MRIEPESLILMPNVTVFTTPLKTNKAAHTEFTKEVNQGLSTTLALIKRDQNPERDNMIN